MILCSNGHENPDGSTYCTTCQTYIGAGPVVTTQKVVVTIREGQLTVMAGAEATCEVVVANGTQSEAAFVLTLQGTEWTTIERSEIVVAAGAEESTRLTFRPPPGLKVLDPLAFIVTATSKTDPQNTATAEGSVTVLTMKQPPAVLDPLRSRGRTHAEHSIRVKNFAGSQIVVEFNPLDTNARLDFEVSPPVLSLGGGDHGVVALRVRPRAQLEVGAAPVVHRFQVDVRLGDVAPITIEGEMEQRAPFRVPYRWLGGMAAVLILILAGMKVFADDDGGGGGTNKPALTYSQVVMQDEPIGYWRFEQTSHADPALDSSGNDLHGIYHGTPKVGHDGALQPPGRAPRFDSVNDWVEIGGAGMPSFDGDFAVEAWILITGKVTFRDAILGPEPPALGDSLNFDQERLRIFDRESKTDPIVAATEQKPDEWTHWAVVREGSTMRIYRNGTLDVEVNAAPFTFSPEAIGHSNGVDSGNKRRFLGGRIDELAIYDHALSSDRVRAHVDAR